MVLRSVCCRAGASRTPLVNTARRWPSRASSAGGGSAHLEPGLERLGACNEECHRLILRQPHEVGQVFEIGQRERRDGKLVLSRKVEHRTAGDQQLEV